MVRRQPRGARLLQDSFRLLFWGLLLGAPLYLHHYLGPVPSGLKHQAARAGACLLAYLLSLSLLRLFIPHPGSGDFRVGWNGKYVLWLLSGALAEVGMHPLLRGPFWLLQWTRVLYLNAMGARIAWSASLPFDLRVRDPSLLRIGADSLLEPGTVVEATLQRVGRLYVARVSIGQGCLIGAQTMLLPGASLGPSVRTGPGAVVGQDATIGVGVVLGEGVHLERGVNLGSHVSVGTGAVLAADVSVEDRARISAGTIVPAGTEVSGRVLSVRNPPLRAGSLSGI